MPFPDPLRLTSGLSIPLRVALLYLLVCTCWILFSDRALFWLVSDSGELTRLQTAKGWLFVLATAFLLHFLVSRYTRALENSLRQRTESEERLRESEERLHLALEAARLGTWSWDMIGDRLTWDDYLCSLFDLSPAEMPADLQGGLARLHPDDRDRVAGEVALCLSKDLEVDTRFRIFLADGTPRYLSARGKLFRDGGGGPRHITGVCWDVTERRLAEQQLQENQTRLEFLAHHDLLTRLPNRVLLQDRLQHALAKARRSGNRVALLFLDMDRFKTINDSLGHGFGDRVLKEIAARLANMVRDADTVARLGGDEFVIVLEEVTEVERVAGVAQKLLLDLGREIVVEGERFFVSASIGISLFPENGTDAEGLLKTAEIAMYRVKASGKNAFHYFTPDMNARTHDLLQLEGSLRRAIDEGQFVLFYQPQVDLSSGALVGVEALLRWQHPEHGFLPPADFIPLAEETGLIVPIGDWVLRTACMQNRAWQEEGRPPIRMAVNISSRQFRQADLVARVAAILTETRLDPHWLELELTESLIMHDVEAAIETMQNLGRMGVHLSIDDFGTGYSSLGYLKRFPLGGLKIDKTFVRDLPGDVSDAQIAASVTDLAHNMNLRVVAEGIERPEQLAFLRRLGCDQGQGFLFSRPVPAGEIPARPRWNL